MIRISRSKGKKTNEATAARADSVTNRTWRGARLTPQEWFATGTYRMQGQTLSFVSACRPSLCQRRAKFTYIAALIVFMSIPKRLSRPDAAIEPVVAEKPAHAQRGELFEFQPAADNCSDKTDYRPHKKSGEG
jgi:hypothetical protein